MEDRTTIELEGMTRDRLRAMKVGGETYDELLQRLIEGDESEEPDPAPAPVDSGGDGERIKCEHCGNVWTTQSEAPRPSCSMCSRKTDRLAP